MGFVPTVPKENVTQHSVHAILQQVSPQVYECMALAKKHPEAFRTSHLPVLLQIILAIRSPDRQISPFSDSRPKTPKLAVQERYNQNSFLSVSSRSLHGIAERPLPCNYNVIQPVIALSRR
jgi:hypothetical protein